MRKSNWLLALGIAALAIGLFFGAAVAHPADGNGEGEYGWRMHEQMDPELYGLMIQRMTEIHGAEFTAQMLQRMNEVGGCHGYGPFVSATDEETGFQGMPHRGYGNRGMMRPYFDEVETGIVRGVQGMMAGLGGMMVR